MRAILRAVVVSIGLGVGACAASPPVATCEAPEPVEPVLEPPLKMIVLVHPEWRHWYGEETPVAYVLMITKMAVYTIEGAAYRASPELQAMVEEFSTYSSPVPVRHITLDVDRKEEI